MTTDTKPRMTVAEIALMREIVKWRKANRYTYLPDRSRYRHRDTWRSVGWVALDSDMPPAVGVSPDYKQVIFDWHRVTSFTEAVDLLVALGYLPQRFSSAYRAGWHAATVWEQHPATARRGWKEEFARLFHDPYNISFPAGMEFFARLNFPEGS